MLALSNLVDLLSQVDDTVGGVGEGLNAGAWAVGLYGYSNYTDVDSLEQWEEMSPTERLERQMHSKAGCLPLVFIVHYSCALFSVLGLAVVRRIH